jgi:hypothetical protein
LDSRLWRISLKFSHHARKHQQSHAYRSAIWPRLLIRIQQLRQKFEGPVRDADTFEITILHSKTEVKGNLINYTRTFEVKELSVPVSRAEELRKFYRIIASDERNTVVLKSSPK